MKYDEAIEAAKNLAKMINMNIIVLEYQPKHWWSRKDYDCTSAANFEELLRRRSVVKRLTITPDGTIAQ